MKRLTIGRLQIYADPRDVWIGVYVARVAVYVCLLPMLVIRWDRQPGPEPDEPIDVDDPESVSATEYALIMMRLGELEGRMADLEDGSPVVPRGKETLFGVGQ